MKLSRQSNSRVNTRDISEDDDSDDDDYDSDVMKEYDAKLPKEVKDIEVVVKTKKHSMVRIESRGTNFKLRLI